MSLPWRVAVSRADFQVPHQVGPLLSHNSQKPKDSNLPRSVCWRARGAVGGNSEYGHVPTVQATKEVTTSGRGAKCNVFLWNLRT